MSARAALLAQILANPDDAAARLVYGDAIGGTRGEAIALAANLALAGITTIDDLVFDPTGDLVTRATQLRRVRALHTAHGEAWRRELGATADDRVELRDGWIHHVHIDERSRAVDLARFVELARGTPIVSLDIRLWSQAAVDALAGHGEALRQVRELVLEGSAGAALAWTALFAAMPDLHTVWWRSRATPEELAAIADHPALRTIEITSPTDDGLAALASGSLARRLACLRVRYRRTQGDTRPYQPCAHEDRVFALFPNAREIAGVSLTYAQCAALAATARLAPRTVLAAAPLTARAVQALAPALAEVTDLDLRTVRLDDDVVGELVRAAPNLARLAIGTAGLGAGGVGTLAAAPALARLELAAGTADMDPGVIVAIARIVDARGLEALRIDGRQGPALARAIVAAPGARALRSLAFGYLPLDAADARAIAGSPHLAGLRELEIPGAGLGRDADVLATLPSLVRLALTHSNTRPSVAFADHPTLVDVPGLEPLADPALRAAMQARFGAELELVSELHLFAGEVAAWHGRSVEMNSICDAWMVGFLRDVGIAASGVHLYAIAGELDVRVRLNAENRDHDLARTALGIDEPMARVIAATDPVIECHFPIEELAAGQRVIRQIACELGGECVLWNKIDDTVEMLGRGSVRTRARDMTER